MINNRKELLMLKKLSFFIGLILINLPSCGYAQGAYIGGGFAFTETESAGSVKDLNYMLFTTVTSESSDNSDSGPLLFVGYDFEFTNYSLGVEAGWIDFGDNTLNGQGNDFGLAGDGTRYVDVVMSADGFTLSGLVQKEVMEKLNLYARAGICSWSVEGHLEGTVYYNSGGVSGRTSEYVSDSGVDPYIGFGFQFHFVRVGYDHFKVSDTNTDSLSISLRF